MKRISDVLSKPLLTMQCCFSSQSACTLGRRSLETSLRNMAGNRVMLRATSGEQSFIRTVHSTVPYVYYGIKETIE